MKCILFYYKILLIPRTSNLLLLLKFKFKISNCNLFRHELKFYGHAWTNSSTQNPKKTLDCALNFKNSHKFPTTWDGGNYFIFILF